MDNYYLEMDGEEIDSSDNDDDGNDSSEEDDMDDSREEDSDEEETSDEDEDEEEVHDNFVRTFSEGDYKVEFDEALNLDRAVTLPAQSTQASYTKPDNWVERNRIGLEKVKKQLQNSIDSLSYGARYKFQLQLRHNANAPWNQLADNEEPIVWHESILDEYWNHFEAEIGRMRQLGIVTDIIGIQFTNVEMKKERLAALVDIIVDDPAGTGKYIRT
jgi:hypothetical protein